MINVSQGKNCYASDSAYSGTSINGPVNGGSYTKPGYAPAWWYVDLGKIYNIGQFSVSLSGGSWNVIVNIQVSEDNINYTNILTEYDSFNGTNVNITNINKRARYVKVVFVGGNSWCGMGNVIVLANMYKLLIQDGSNKATIQTDNTLLNLGSEQYSYEMFNQYGLDELVKMNKNIINSVIVNNKYKIALYKYK